MESRPAGRTPPTSVRTAPSTPGAAVPDRGTKAVVVVEQIIDRDAVKRRQPVHQPGGQAVGFAMLQIGIAGLGNAHRRRDLALEQPRPQPAPAQARGGGIGVGIAGGTAGTGAGPRPNAASGRAGRSIAAAAHRQSQRPAGGT